MKVTIYDVWTDHDLTDTENIVNILDYLMKNVIENDFQINNSWGIEFWPLYAQKVKPISWNNERCLCRPLFIDPNPNELRYYSLHIVCNCKCDGQKCK